MQARRIGLSLALLGVTFTALAGCGEMALSRSGGPVVEDPTRDYGRELQPRSPNQDPDDVPTNIPQPIPQPLNPPAPGELTVKAVAHSISSNPLSAFDGRSFKTIAVYTDLSWTPLREASSYRILRAEEGSDRFVVRGTVSAPRTVFRDGGSAFGNLNVGTEYRYVIEALDTSGRKIARGNDACRPLYPLDLPALKSPENGQVTSGLQPVLRWSYSDHDGRTKEGPDGFYVEVFSGQYLVPLWRGYRQGNVADSIQYGNQVDFYPGTAPAIWTSVLQPGARYTWTVTAYKTDTGNAKTAKAFAKSNAPAWSFSTGQ